VMSDKGDTCDQESNTEQMLDEGSMASRRRKDLVKEKDSTLVFKIFEPKTKSELTLVSD
jgi:hypothetical protein